ncbi:hypothetical protein [Rubrivivax gelatinosus]|uniref:Transmembrane protein n=1 Tax=Rubrivivax gelatinosus TaxID=28068 RepID=A0A4R2MJ74_RUBGE|nr:hypothetical protein [Rubrivivax gelatinosus]MBK1689379.1 hypothetical protein [Rubrivivax gelatinosus]TCP05355.1 hypothetical protein EV684_101227 [Rubrivivax gelatinosus]
MANSESTTSGFTLPAPTDSAPSAAGTGTTVALPGDQLAGAYPVGTDTSSRDLLIGGGILLVLFVAFFFAKNAYANTLVGKRVPPNKANAAGWWMFVLLASLSTGVVLSAVNASKFMTPLILGPVGAVGLLALALMLTTGRK